MLVVHPVYRTMRDTREPNKIRSVFNTCSPSCVRFNMYSGTRVIGAR